MAWTSRMMIEVRDGEFAYWQFMEHRLIVAASLEPTSPYQRSLRQCDEEVPLLVSRHAVALG